MELAKKNMFETGCSREKQACENNDGNKDISFQKFICHNTITSDSA